MQSYRFIIGSKYSFTGTISLTTAFILKADLVQKVATNVQRKLATFKKTNPDYDKPSAINAVIEADVNALLMRDGF